VIVELCWILPWFVLLTQVTSIAPVWVAGLVLGSLMLTSYALACGLEELRIRKNLLLIFLLALLMGGLILAENLLLGHPIKHVAGGLISLDPGAILVLFFVVWMWWRGLTLARYDIRPTTAWRRFELGLLFFMAYLFIATRLHNPAPGLAVSMLFLFSGLLAVAFARVSYVGLQKGVQKNPFDLRWSLSVGGILGATVLIAAFAGGLLSGQYRLLLDFLSSLLKLLIAIVIFLFGLPGLLVSVIVGNFLPWLLNLFRPQQIATPPEYPIQNLAPFFSDQTKALHLSPLFQTLCFWSLVILIVAVLIIRVRRSLTGGHFVEPVEPESLLREGDAGRLMRKAFQDVWDRLGARLRPFRRMIVAARIRHIYVQLLDLCESLGQPHHSHQTPQEFLPVMGELFSAQIQELGLLTHAYERVRYGELPERTEDVKAIEEAWARLQEAGRRLKKSGLGNLQTVKTEEVEKKGV